MRPFCVLVTGLFLLTTLGCDQLRELAGEHPPAPASASAPAAPVHSAPLPSVSAAAASPPAATQNAPQVAPGSVTDAPKPPSGPVLQLTEGAAAAGLSVNQLKLTPAPAAGPVAAGPLSPLPAASAAKPRVNASKVPVWHEVTVYAVFGAPFSRRIELRAHDANGGELGRSEREAALSQAGDSARYVTFRFDPRMPLEQARTFAVYVDPIPQAAAEPPKPKSTTPAPAPAPEPQFIRPDRPGLVPKDP